MRAYKVIDAFSATPFLGNPVAVLLETEGLDTVQMQAIARWTNLSETTFLLPADEPQADYRLRIFTPLSELPFAGHPTLGSAHAILEAGLITPKDGVMIQQCGVGLIRIEVAGKGPARELTLSLPPAQMTALTTDEVAELEAILGVEVDHDSPPAKVNVGPVWIVARMKDADTVLALTPDFTRSAVFERRLGVTGISVFGHGAQGADIEVRSFAPGDGINEDPVCGSGNGAIAVFQAENGLIPAKSAAYVAAQGQCVGRNGRVRITIDDTGQIKVGGQCVTCVDGRLAN